MVPHPARLRGRELEQMSIYLSPHPPMVCSWPRSQNMCLLTTDTCRSQKEYTLKMSTWRCLDRKQWMENQGDWARWPSQHHSSLGCNARRSQDLSVHPHGTKEQFPSPFLPSIHTNQHHADDECTDRTSLWSCYSTLKGQEDTAGTLWGVYTPYHLWKGMN